MVSQSARPASASRRRLLAAAAGEFAARGFDGAKVDRIAARARVNKAMLYYHFRDKAALYRVIVGEQFEALAAAVAVPGPGAAPDDRLRRFIATVAAELAARPHFPAIWLREMAEGGRHLDPAIVGALRRILGVLAAILRDGQQAGVFRPAHPLVTQMGIVAPLLLFAASAPVRARFRHLVPGDIAAVTREAVVAHVEAATLAFLSPGVETPSRDAVRTGRRRS